MDKDIVKGSIKQAQGTAKQKIGKVTGDKTLQIKGAIQEAEGTVQKEFGKAKDALRKGD